MIRIYPRFLFSYAKNNKDVAFVTHLLSPKKLFTVTKNQLTSLIELEIVNDWGDLSTKEEEDKLLRAATKWVNH